MRAADAGVIFLNLPFHMRPGRVIAAYIVSPIVGGIYWVVLNGLVSSWIAQMWLDPVGIVSILGLFTVIGYVAEGLLGTPLLFWFRRRGFSSLRWFLLGGLAVAIVVWLFASLLYSQILREMSLVFNLMFLLVGCIVPALLSTTLFWFIAGRQITRAWSGLAGE